MPELITVNSCHRESIVILDGNGSPVTGLREDQFTVFSSLDGVSFADEVKIEEVDPANNPGEYSISFTPKQEGLLVVRVSHVEYEPFGWIGNYRVVSPLVDTAFVPKITSVTALSDQVCVEFVGEKDVRYRAQLCTRGDVVEHEMCRLGGGNVNLIPLSPGVKLAKVVATDNHGNERSKVAISLTTVPWKEAPLCLTK